MLDKREVVLYNGFAELNARGKIVVIMVMELTPKERMETMKRYWGSNVALTRNILVFFFVMLSTYCFAGNPDDNLVDGFIDGDVPSHNVLQKIAQEIDYNQEIKIIQSLSGGNWIDQYKVVRMYDGGGNCTEVLSQAFEHGAWINSKKGFYTYNKQGNCVERIVLDWKNDEWVNYFKENFSYDEQRNMNEELEQVYGNGKWKYSHKRTYTYDSDGNMAEWLRESWSGSKWETHFQYFNTFDDQGNMIETRQVVGVNKPWSIKIFYTYDDGLKTEELHQTWYDEEYDLILNTRKATFTYNDQGNLTEELLQLMVDSEWTNSYGHTNTYDEQGRMTELRFQSWRDGEWVSSTKALFSYDSHALNIADNTGDVPAKILLTANYPNPFNPTTTIEFTLPEAGYAELSIYNMTGQLIRVLETGEMSAGVHSAVWDGRDMSGELVSSGVFFSRLITMDNVVTNRMLLVK